MDMSKYKHLLPIAIDVEQGKSYTWCGCGKSKTPPFCDKSNCKEALTVCAKQNETLSFCNCKQTKTPPYCDGSHAKVLMELLKSKK